MELWGFESQRNFTGSLGACLEVGAAGSGSVDPLIAHARELAKADPELKGILEGPVSEKGLHLPGTNAEQKEQLFLKYLRGKIDPNGQGNPLWRRIETAFATARLVEGNGQATADSHLTTGEISGAGLSSQEVELRALTVVVQKHYRNFRQEFPEVLVQRRYGPMAMDGRGYVGLERRLQQIDALRHIPSLTLRYFDGTKYQAIQMSGTEAYAHYLQRLQGLVEPELTELEDRRAATAFSWTDEVAKGESLSADKMREAARKLERAKDLIFHVWGEKKWATLERFALVNGIAPVLGMYVYAIFARREKVETDEAKAIGKLLQEAKVAFKDGVEAAQRFKKSAHDAWREAVRSGDDPAARGYWNLLEDAKVRISQLKAVERDFLSAKNPDDLAAALERAKVFADRPAHPDMVRASTAGPAVQPLGLSRADEAKYRSLDRIWRNIEERLDDLKEAGVLDRVAGLSTNLWDLTAMRFAGQKDVLAEIDDERDPSDPLTVAISPTVATAVTLPPADGSAISEWARNLAEEDSRLQRILVDDPGDSGFEMAGLGEEGFLEYLAKGESAERVEDIRTYVQWAQWADMQGKVDGWIDAADFSRLPNEETRHRVRSLLVVAQRWYPGYLKFHHREGSSVDKLGEKNRFQGEYASVVGSAEREAKLSHLLRMTKFGDQWQLVEMPGETSLLYTVREYRSEVAGRLAEVQKKLDTGGQDQALQAVKKDLEELQRVLSWKMRDLHADEKIAAFERVLGNRSSPARPATPPASPPAAPAAKVATRPARVTKSTKAAAASAPPPTSAAASSGNTGWLRWNR